MLLHPVLNATKKLQNYKEMFVHSVSYTVLNYIKQMQNISMHFVSVVHTHIVFKIPISLNNAF